MTSHQEHQQAKSTQHHSSTKDRSFIAPQHNPLCKNKRMCLPKIYEHTRAKNIHILYTEIWIKHLYLSILLSVNHPNMCFFLATDCGHSFSGSETDVSTSTENLSPEERYALEHTQRQEPQGQENVSSTVSTMANMQANDSLISGASSMSNHRSNE